MEGEECMLNLEMGHGRGCSKIPVYQEKGAVSIHNKARPMKDQERNLVLR